MDYIALGQRVRRIRKQKGLTQEVLAEQVGISASFIGHIERGSRIASLETLMQLCRALAVSPNDLLGEPLVAQVGELPETITLSPAALMEDIAMLIRKQKNPQ